MDRIRQRLSGLPRTPLELNRSLQLLGSLRQRGWHRSLDSLAVGPDGEHVPWWTYPALHWILPKIQPSDRILEYGGGASSVWFDRHAGEVHTIEGDPEWATWIRNHCDVKLVDEPSGEYDVVVVDGGDREANARQGMQHLDDGGMVVFDNSDRYESLVASLGLERLDFHGFGPVNGYEWTTTLLYQD